MREIKVNEPTRYEVALCHPDGREYVLGYTVRKSKHVLVRVVQGEAQHVLTVTGLGKDCGFTFMRGSLHPGMTLDGTDWVVSYTGRTQRDVAHSGKERSCIRTAAELMLAQDAVANAENVA